MHTKFGIASRLSMLGDKVVNHTFHVGHQSASESPPAYCVAPEPGWSPLLSLQHRWFLLVEKQNPGPTFPIVMSAI